MLKPGTLDQLHQVHELNRAFLGLLQSRLRQRRSCFGLPSSAHAVVTAAGAALIEVVAAVPRALFCVQLASPAPALFAGAPADFDDGEQHLCLSILLATRQTSRQSEYHARLLFGLASADVERLRASPLADMQRLARMPGVLVCAFGERQWLWAQLFTATRPELRRQLTLMALQPCLAVGWPQRRPPRSTA